MHRLVVGTLFLAHFAWVSCSPVFAQNPSLEDSFESTEIESSTPIEPSYSEQALKESLWELSLGSEARFERSADSSEDNESVNFGRFGVGYKKNSWVYQLQYGVASTESRSGLFNVETRTQEMLLQASYFSKPTGWWSPVVGLGLGGFQESVRSNLANIESVNSESDLLFLGQAHGGVRFRIWKTFIQLQSNVLKKETNPNLEFAFLGQLGMSL